MKSKILLCNEETLSQNKGIFEVFKKYFNEVVIVKEAGDINLSISNDYLVIGNEVSTIINDNFKLGLRGSRVARLYRLPFLNYKDIRILFVKDCDFNHRDNKEKLKYFLSNDFGKQKVNSDTLKYRIIQNAKEAINILEEWKDNPEHMGFDYETTALVESEIFEITGAGISTVDNAIFIDFRYIKHQNSVEEYKEFLDSFEAFLDHKQQDLWVFNYGFEMKCSYQYFKKYYEFNDVKAYRIIDGNNEDPANLKYCAQYYLGVKSWDDEFEDAISNGVEDNEEVRYLKSLGYTEPYGVIPSETLGKYCCLDSYYTLQIHQVNKGKFSKLCVDSFMNNIRFSDRIVGLIRSDEYPDYINYNDSLLLYSLYNLIISYYRINIRIISDTEILETDNMSKLDNYILQHHLYFESPAKISKDFLNTCFDEEYELEFNENKAHALLGEYAEEIIRLIKENIEPNISACSRKRKCHEIIGEAITKNSKIPDMVASGIREETVVNTMKFLSLKYQLDWLTTNVDIFKISLRQIYDKEFINYDGEKLNKFEAFNRLKQILNPFSIAFNDVSPLLLKYGSREFSSTVEKGKKRDLAYLLSVEDDKYSEADTYIKEQMKEQTKHNFLKNVIWDKIEVNEEFMDYINGGNAIDANKCLTFVLSMYHILLVRHSFKINSYLRGLLNSKMYNGKLDHKLNPIYNDEYIKKGLYLSDRNYITLNPWYGVNNKATKRWSSSMHTLYSTSNVKRLIVAPKGYLIGYFDISQAEARVLVYLSGEQKLIDRYERGEDIYMGILKQVNDMRDEKYKVPESEFPRVRVVAKQLFLGLMYGMGFERLSNDAKISVEDAKDFIYTLFTSYPSFAKFIRDRSDYPARNNYVINTELGDIINLDPYERLDQTRRKGVNYCIQGFTAIIAASGYYNILRASDKEGMGLCPISTVHDSVTYYIPFRSLNKLNAFLDKHFCEFISENHKVKFKFDLYISSNLSDLMIPSFKDDGWINVKGYVDPIKNMIKSAVDSGYKIELNKESQNKLNTKYDKNFSEGIIEGLVRKNHYFPNCNDEIDIDFKIHE